MRKLLLGTILFFLAFLTQAQTNPAPVRLSITSVMPAENTGQDYSPWLNDNLNKLVQSAWSGNEKWVQVTLKLQQKSLVTSLSLYDYEGTFTDKPALLYAMNGTQRVLIGSFTGESYKAWVTLTPLQPLIADAIMIYKYGNNIPQKIKAFGQPITASTVIPKPLDLLKLVSATDKPVTGQNYSAYLNDDMSKLVPTHWSPDNQQWTDVTIKFDKKSLLTKLEAYDYEDSFEATPADIYAYNGKEKTLLGRFTGDSYMEFKTYAPSEPIVAEGLIIHKYNNAIPVKLRAYGKVLPADPLDAILYAQERVKVVAINTDVPTPQSYAAYLNDDMNSLVQDEWHPDNNRWVELNLKLEHLAEVTKLELFDGSNVWNDTPASIYAVKGTTRTLLGTFTGPDYMTWQTLTPPQSLTADAIIIRKYGNALPLKVRVYGHLVDEPVVITPPTSPTVAPPVVLGDKIPLTASRWYQLNNTTSGLDGLFDGNTQGEIQTGYGKILSNYDAYYPLQPGESMSIKAIKFFDGNGTNTNAPLRLSIITNDWRRVEIAQFQGLEYEAWVGPYPGRQPAGNAKFLLDNVITDARYLVINTSDFWPREIELYGSYQAPTQTASAAPRKSPTFKNLTGINGFEWDFFPPGVSTIDEAKMKALQSFGVIRHYMDWEKLEQTEGNYTFNPTHSGGWNYDLMYERCKAAGMEVMACLKDIAPYLKATYPADQQGNDNVPVAYGRDYSKPASYIEQARVAFQYAARYGKNTQVDPALVKVDSRTRWTNDPANVVKIGLGLINYIECDNERDKWWRGRLAYQTGREYAAQMSAFYDGHKNTMGPGAGVKNADPSMVVVMGGLCSVYAGTDYIRGMIDWCREFRGYKGNGQVDLCWDVINYHLYPDNNNSSQGGSSTRGAAPELSIATQVARNVVKLAHEACYDMPVYVSETGYDLHQGSPLHAIAIGPKSVEQTQADWNLRTALLYAREGVERVDFYQTYDLNIDCATQFCSMGLINQNFSRKITADYFYQTKKLIGDYVFKETLSTNPNVDRYERNGQSVYALWVPDEVGRTSQYTLNLGTSSAKVYTPQTAQDTLAMRTMNTSGGNLALTVTETPIFVVADGFTGAPRLAAEVTDQPLTIRAYPNPSTDYVMLEWANDYIGDVAVQVVDGNLGTTHKQLTIQKEGPSFSTKIDLSSLPYGLHLINIQQGSERFVKKILKVW
ncbi:T9SS type A sorting domain-containing protein [Fibrella forsythiae]|uniref:T9SS type A sorting domain-containing protein n=1 Tax=Fibrella forsythiae TaxID=2817061 RepID=A0ABS3JP25_9BACT|nr:T9SS type A sorting domain-containing protein [Fibrella forsythiae]MBO0951755.1 T9SS type A sorting domain-containing protein [Fibrella forsythiae]